MTTAARGAAPARAPFAGRETSSSCTARPCRRERRACPPCPARRPSECRARQPWRCTRCGARRRRRPPPASPACRRRSPGAGPPDRAPTADSRRRRDRRCRPRRTRGRARRAPANSSSTISTLTPSRARRRLGRASTRNGGAGLDQLAGEIGADETRTAGDQRVHQPCRASVARAPGHALQRCLVPARSCRRSAKAAPRASAAVTARSGRTRPSSRTDAASAAGTPRSAPSDTRESPLPAPRASPPSRGCAPGSMPTARAPVSSHSRFLRGRLDDLGHRQQRPGRGHPPQRGGRPPPPGRVHDDLGHHQLTGRQAGGAGRPARRRG